MKLKKAIREHAQAVDALAWATMRKRDLEDIGLRSEAIETDLVYAHKEYKRTLRQIAAVMIAMQYRGEDQIARPMPRVVVTNLRTTRNVARYIARNRMMGIQGEIYARAIVKWCDSFGVGCNTSSLMREIANVLDEYRFEDGYCHQTYGMYD